MATRSSARRKKPGDDPLFAGYEPLTGTYDEFVDASGKLRPQAREVAMLLEQLGRRECRERRKLADATFLQSGVTFSVYSDERGGERILPFDLVPRVIAAEEWSGVRAGLEQRVRALNAFLGDLYGEQRILAEGVVPREMVLGARGYRPEVQGIRPPKGVYVHIAGVDLVRGSKGEFLVLEDNVRVPSGVSYVLENRMVMKKVFPRVFSRSRVSPVEAYPSELRAALSAVSTGGDEAEAVVLTPGPYNSAYFEHSFLARRMGCDLVEPRDLFVDDDKVYAKTTRGPQRVGVIYRRVDDDFLDPDVFRKDSLLGVRGIVGAYAKGNVALANAIGNGAVDDKAVYPFVPEMVRFYLSEEPILGQVRTYVCDRPDDRAYVLEHVDELVVKAVNEAGGYGMLVGPRSTRKQQAEFRAKIRENPRNYIAQPLVELSTAPTWVSSHLEPRRVDLRPYVVTGERTWVLPGGLTRVALVRGSYVVNSSQGGGSKDTWVLEGGEPC